MIFLILCLVVEGPVVLWVNRTAANCQASGPCLNPAGGGILCGVTGFPCTKIFNVDMTKILLKGIYNYKTSIQEPR